MNAIPPRSTPVDVLPREVRCSDQTSPLFAIARLAPGQKLLEQPLAIFRFRRGVAARCQKRLEIVADRRGRLLLRRAIALQPFLSRGKPGPSRQRGGEIGLVPLGMARRLL